MPIPASFALQAAMHAALVAEPALLSLLGGPRVHDDATEAGPFPYVTLGPAASRDWSTAAERGDEHFVTLQVFSRGAGKKEALAVLDVLRGLLHDAPLTLTDHRLVNLRHETTDTRRESDGETMRGTIRFRAVTEPLS